MKFLRGAQAAVLLCGILLAAAGQQARTSAWAQTSASQAAAPDAAGMRQLRQAVSLAGHHDYQGALTIVDQLLKKNPRFADALKLKAMLF
jgi:uncharacterized protein HemY